MSDTSNDPRHQRFFQTSEGVISIPRDQQGVKMTDYFKNIDLPKELDRAVVYATAKGPVLAEPEPEAWSQRHDNLVQQYTESLKTQIDERGYYARSLSHYASRLSDYTGRPKDEMKAVISQRFAENHGKDPYTYLNDQRVAQGKPVRQPGQNQEITHDQDG